MSKTVPVLEVDNVSKQFAVEGGEVKALKDVSFSVPDGSFTIVYGPSGSGKSTLLDLLVGMEAPTQGTVKLRGQDMYALSPDERAGVRSRQIGIVYQSNYWVKSLNVVENVALPLYLQGLTKSDAVGRALHSLERVEMQKYAKHHPTVLSGGQQQRISMARALVSDPEVIVADEPTGNLDSENGDMIMALLNSICRDLKSTIILVTHNLAYLPLSDHQLYIKDGVLTETFGQNDPAEALLKDMQARVKAIRAIRRPTQ